MTQPTFQAPLESSHSHHRKENIIFRSLRNNFLTGQAERKLWKKGYKRVACLDEVGRGALAGPVVAAAVMINPKFKTLNSKQDQNSKTEVWRSQTRCEMRASPSASSKCSKHMFRILNFGHLNLFRISDFGFRISGIRDSKKLSPKMREKFYEILTTHPGIWWGIGRVSEKVIDRINIKNAAELAMWRAVQKLKHRPDFLIIDGKYLKNYKLKTLNYKLIVKADEKIFSCAAASIIAKIYRDRIMRRYHKKYPKYGFAKHKGYPTREHLKNLKKYKLCPIHRKSFRPVLENLRRG